MDLAQRYAILVARRLAVQEGLEMLTRAQAELRADIDSGRSWGQGAVMLNAILIPCNVVINAFGLNSAKSAFQIVARMLYEQAAMSGKRGPNTVNVVLKALREAIVSELKRKGLGQFVPGVTILVGLAQDSAALVDVASTVDRGQFEMRALARQLDEKIQAAIRQLALIGTEVGQLLEKANVVGHTA